MRVRKFSDVGRRWARTATNVSAAFLFVFVGMIAGSGVVGIAGSGVVGIAGSGVVGLGGLGGLGNAASGVVDIIAGGPSESFCCLHGVVGL